MGADVAFTVGLAIVINSRPASLQLRQDTANRLDLARCMPYFIPSTVRLETETVRTWEKSGVCFGAPMAPFPINPSGPRHPLSRPVTSVPCLSSPLIPNIGLGCLPDFSRRNSHIRHGITRSTRFFL
ncbi:hypothetical protein BDW75DRAFT_202918 [Aspergillus navahoensis]